MSKNCDLTSRDDQITGALRKENIHKLSWERRLVGQRDTNCWDTFLRKTRRWCLRSIHDPPIAADWASRGAARCWWTRSTPTCWSSARSFRSCGRCDTTPCTAGWSLTGSGGRTWTEFWCWRLHSRPGTRSAADSRESSRSALDSRGTPWRSPRQHSFLSQKSREQPRCSVCHELS